MLIPSIDLMGGKIVQLVQGEKKALEFDDFEYWIERFSAYPLVQLIDLDAAMGRGSNRELITTICKRLPCQTGGGGRVLPIPVWMTHETTQLPSEQEVEPWFEAVCALWDNPLLYDEIAARAPTIPAPMSRPRLARSAI